MKILKMVLRLACVVLIAVAIITHNPIIAAGSVSMASLNLGILIGERSRK